MRSKLSWIPFIPLTLIAAFCMLAQGMFEEGYVFGLSNLYLNYAFIGCVVLVFIFTLIFCLTDKRISPYYLARRNYVAGIVGILLALVLAADGADMIIRLIGSGTLNILKIVEAVLLLFSSVVFVVLGLSHSFKGSDGKPMSLLSIVPALMCAVRMVSCFVEFTTVSLRSADVCRLVCYIFATLFFFNYAVTLTLTKAKNAVKSCFIFGFPAASALLGYSAYHLVYELDLIDPVANIRPAEMALMGIYILAFLVELTIFIPEKSRVRVLEGDEEIEDSSDDDARDSEGFIVNKVEDETEDTPSSYLTTADTSDYLYKEVAPEEAPAQGAAMPDMDNYLTEIQQENDGKTDDRPVDYESRLDDIDKLILEISKEDK